MQYSRVVPDASLSDFVNCFWCLANDTGEQKRVAILPDGYFDVLALSVKDHPSIFLSSG